MKKLAPVIAFALCLIATHGDAKSYVVFPNALKEAAIQLSKAVDGMQFVEKSLKDVAAEKSPPAKSDSWNAVIFSAENLAETIKKVNLSSGHKMGDWSVETQMDCAKFETVLDVYKAHLADLTDTEPLLPPLIEHLSGMSRSLREAIKSADDLSKTYAYMSASPHPKIVDFFAWASYDLMRVSKALSGAKAAVDKKLTGIEKYKAGFTERLKDAKRLVVDYQARIPKQRAYCATKR